MGSRAKTTIAALLAAALLAAGCGGDDGGGSSGSSGSSATARQPEPKQPISAEVPRVNRALADRSCRELEPLRFSIIRRRPPGSPATAAECKRSDETLLGLKGVTFVRSAEYGTGAITEARDGKYAIWALDGDGHYRLTGVGGVSRQVGTPFASRAAATATASRFLAAVRRRDCRAIEPLLDSRGSRLVVGTGSARAGCRALLRGAFLAPSLRRTPRPRVDVLGGTRNFAVVGVATKSIYFTLLLKDVGNGLHVLDVLPATPVRLPTH